jgi:hypothetical protein
MISQNKSNLQLLPQLAEKIDNLGLDSSLANLLSIPVGPKVLDKLHSIISLPPRTTEPALDVNSLASLGIRKPPH